FCFHSVSEWSDGRVGSARGGSSMPRLIPDFEALLIPDFDALELGGSPRTVRPDAFMWNTMWHFLQTSREFSFSRGTDPDRPQFGHARSITPLPLWTACAISA